jgi:TetR/AcrR family transcriptional regulator, tetracycline repressor protein
MSPTKTATRGQLSRDVVVDKALQLAAQDGLAAVTIRALATAFDVTPMALYWHFTTKDDLLAAMADRVLDSIRIETSDDAPWSEQLRAALSGLVQALRTHPQIAPLVPTRITACPSGLTLTERALAALAAGGFSTAEAAQIAGQAMLTAITLVTSDRVDDSGTSAAERDEQLRVKQASIAALPTDRYPHLVAAAADLTRCADTEYFFGFGIDLFIAGVEGLAPASEPVGADGPHCR